MAVLSIFIMELIILNLVCKESNILFCLNDTVSFIKIRVNLKWRKNWKMLG